MASRTARARIARETLDILARGWYSAPDGRRVPIADLLARAQAGSRLVTPDDFGALLRGRAAVAPSHPTEFRVVNCTTLAAAGQLVRDGAADVCCLNFASAKNPGGGFLNGSQAQEESLARASGLYACIGPMRAMYDTNRQFGSCLYTDHMIYSPGVPVFRDDDDALLAEPYTAAFITAPAVSVGALHPRERRLIEPTMLARAEKVLALAAAHGHEALVLGAWGCGVFRNDPADVARWFRQHLGEGGSFRGAFRTVVFAVLDRSEDERTLKSFETAFG
jgi:uncharacterized protein (TIGR02452 family)